MYLLAKISIICYGGNKYPSDSNKIHNIKVDDLKINFIFLVLSPGKKEICCIPYYGFFTTHKMFQRAKSSRKGVKRCTQTCATKFQHQESMIINGHRNVSLFKSYF